MAAKTKTIPDTAIGSVVHKARIQPLPAGAQPIILTAQIDGFVPCKTPEELAQWQEDLRLRTGISIDASDLVGIAGECCSGGCSDQCDLLK